MRREGRSVLTAVAVLAAVLSALAFFGQLGWIVDLLAQFRFQALLGSVVLLLVLVFLRAWRGVAAASLALGLNAYALYDVPLAATASAPGAIGEPSLRIVAFNLEGNDRRIDNVLIWLREQKFDVVSFEELTPAFAAQLDAVADLYPYQLLRPRKGGFGIGIISRHPFTFRSIPFSDGPWRLALRVRIEWNDAEVEIVAVHPPPPLGGPMAREHDDILNDLATLPPNPRRIVMGDFNAAPTSLAMRRLMRQLDLGAPSRVPRLTWPSYNFWPLQIPIDHVLVGGDLALVSVENGPNLGSDHFPQIAVVAAKKTLP